MKKITLKTMAPESVTNFVNDFVTYSNIHQDSQEKISSRLSKYVFEKFKALYEVEMVDNTPVDKIVFFEDKHYNWFILQYPL